MRRMRERESVCDEQTKALSNYSLNSQPFYLQLNSKIFASSFLTGLVDWNIIFF